MSKARIVPEPPARSAGDVEYAARLEIPGVAAGRLWFRLPEARCEWVTGSADPFLIGALFAAMRSRCALHVEGRVSASLLRNLDDFQAAWSAWWPDRYPRVAVSAEHEEEDEPAAGSRAVLAFSGGLDSCFSAWRHTRGGRGAATVDLRALVMAHGFDIPLAERDVFARAAERSSRLAESLGLELVTVTSNVRELAEDWEQTHGAALASCLHLLRGGFAKGLIASSHTYATLRFPWGSNPLTDPLLSSAAFPILYDGTAFARREKARAVASWPQAMRDLRVCWEGAHKDRNCGACLRCVTTAAAFAVERVPVPPALGVDDLAAGFEGLTKTIAPAAFARTSELLAAARAAGIDEPWVDACARFLRRQRRAILAARARDAVRRRLKALGGARDAAAPRPAPDPDPHGERAAPALRAGGAQLYRELDREVDRRLNASLGFSVILAETAYPMDDDTVLGFRARYALVKRFQQRTLELFRASLRGECDPAIAQMVVGDLPASLGLEYHRSLGDEQFRTPVFFRTDEVVPGRVGEVQCCGSGWGIAEQLRVLYDAHPERFGTARHFPETLSSRFAAALRRYVGREPVVHHLDQNASLPHDVRYFVQRLREHGIAHFSYDGRVAPQDCNFVRSHDFVTLPHHNFFAERMQRCRKGEVLFDLPPACLFDVKLTQAFPFWEKTRDWYDDELRTLFPYTTIVAPEGLRTKDGELVACDDLWRLPDSRRDYYLKYAGTDIAVNWGSRAVFLASQLSRDRCRRTLQSIVEDHARGRHWIAQEALRHAETVRGLDRDGGSLHLEGYAKLSGFYGPDGLMAVVVYHRRSHKVHGQPDTVASLVR